MSGHISLLLDIVRTSFYTTGAVVMNIKWNGDPRTDPNFDNIYGYQTRFYPTGDDSLAT